jgi:hypothetical protein
MARPAETVNSPTALCRRPSTKLQKIASDRSLWSRLSMLVPILSRDHRERFSAFFSNV